MTQKGKNSAWHREEGKSRVDLIPPKAILGIGQVYTFGLNKYGERNWEEHADEWSWGQLAGSAERHLLAWKMREDDDPESGLPHLLHAAWNIISLYTLQDNRRGHDDRTILTPKMARAVKAETPRSAPTASPPEEAASKAAVDDMLEFTGSFVSDWSAFISEYPKTQWRVSPDHRLVVEKSTWDKFVEWKEHRTLPTLEDE